jgi:hypothetical protein
MILLGEPSPTADDAGRCDGEPDPGHSCEWRARPAQLRSF